jgi:hypothetical protein
MPDSLETHIYAPLGLDIRGKWSVGGSLPFEPRRPRETGAGIPRTGLYIKEEVMMTCSSLLLRFVKRTFKDSHARLVEKLVERAHILESNFANERLKALRKVEPRERMAHGSIFIAPPPDYQLSPPPYSALRSPRPSHSRSQSASPVLTPGHSQSTFPEKSMRLPSPLSERPASSQSYQKPAAAPEEELFLLPATTYNGGAAKKADRPISIWPANAFELEANHDLSNHNETSGSDESDGPDSPIPPHLAYYHEKTPEIVHDEPRSPGSSHFQSPTYAPEFRTISFNFAFDQSSPLMPMSSDDILADIDAAIDEAFVFSRYDPMSPVVSPKFTKGSFDTLPATTYSEPTTSVTLDKLPETTFLSPTTYLSPSTYLPPRSHLPPTKAQSPKTQSPKTQSPKTESPKTESPTTYLSPKTYQPPTAPLATLPATTYTTLPSTTYTTLPSTTYSAQPKQKPTPGPLLPAATYEPAKPRKERKDSVMPYQPSSDVPPVPPKDEKYLRGAMGSGITS